MYSATEKNKKPSQSINYRFY